MAARSFTPLRLSETSIRVLGGSARARDVRSVVRRLPISTPGLQLVREWCVLLLVLLNHAFEMK